MKMVSFNSRPPSRKRPGPLTVAVPASQAKVALPTMEGYLFRPVRAILYLKAEGNYTEIYFVDGTQELICRTLRSVQALIGNYPQFVRVHRSYTVNIDHMDKYIRGKGGFVVLEGGKEISVANSKKEALARAISHHFGAQI